MYEDAGALIARLCQPKVHKTLGFADSLDLLGSGSTWYETTSLELTRTMRHRLNNGNLQANSNHNPALSPTDLIGHSHLAETLEVEFAEPQDIVQHCNNCVAGVDHTLQISNGDVLGEILMDHFRRSETNMCTDRMNLRALRNHRDHLRLPVL